MEKKESNLIIALKLTLICFVAVLLLSLVNLITDPIIKINQKEIENESNKSLFKNGEKFIKKDFRSLSENEKKDFYYFDVKDSNDNSLGYVVASNGNGYGGKLKIMIALDFNLKILNVMLLDNNETPGLGRKAQKSVYMEKFKGTNTNSNPLPMNKNNLSSEEKDSITGATLTFNGIVDAISQAINLMKKETRR